MAAVHSSNNSDHRGTASPGVGGVNSWHFPKSGLGTPELFYSFSGGAAGAGGGGPSSPSASVSTTAASGSNQPAWFKPQGGGSGGASTSSARNNAPPQASSSTSSSSTAPAPNASAANSNTIGTRKSSRLMKTEEVEDSDKDKESAAARNSGGDDDDIKPGNSGNAQAKSSLQRKPDGHEEANRGVRALSDPPVRQSPAWIFPAAGLGGQPRTHLESEPNPFEHSFSRTDSDPTPLQQQQHNVNNHQHQGAQASLAHAAHSNNNNNGPYGVSGRTGSFEYGPPRRARSQSPKSAGWQHSGIPHGLPGHPANGYMNAYHHQSGPGYPGPQGNQLSNPYFPAPPGAHNNSNSSKGGVFAGLSTPSSEIPNFNWGGFGAGNLFDPTSIRTGLTPGGGGNLNGVQSDKRPTEEPHSPATQALFAMMTNATPGADVSAYNSNQKQYQQQQQQGQHPPLIHQPPSALAHNAALGNTSRTTSNSSNNSSNSVPQAGNNNATGPQYTGVFAPQMPPGAIPYVGGNGAQGRPSQLGPSHLSYQQGVQQPQPGLPAGNPAFLQQTVPRPLPPHVFNSNSSSNPSSSMNSIPQLPQQPQRGGDQNPLYLLSQQVQSGDGQSQPQPHQVPLNAAQIHANDPGMVPHQQPGGRGGPQHRLRNEQRPPSDSSNAHNEDAMLAAAALSGLSTPRPVYVGGPAQMPSVNPGTISAAQPVPNLVQPPVGRQKSQAQNLQNKATPADVKPNLAGGTKGRKGGASSTGSTNKRKKGDLSTPPPGSTDKSESANKKPRRTSRRNVASATQSVTEQEQDRDAESADELEGDGDGGEDGDDMEDMDEDEMASNNGSINDWQAGMSRMGADGEVSPPRKGGRGPKQHFSTEEDKRKNFLERNRQAALKCRQRKKQWLTQLQSKVEYLTADNETLQSTVAHLRDEVANLRAILAVHKDCPLNVPPGPGVPGGTTTVGAYMHSMHQPPTAGHPQQRQRGQF